MPASTPTASPVFVKHDDIAILEHNIPLHLCNAINRIAPESAICAQRMGAYWHLFATDDESRDAILTAGGLSVANTLITVYDTLPIVRQIPNERIVFKNVPFDVNNDVLKNFLKQHHQIVLKSDIMLVKIRDGNELTSFYNGDRFAYVRGQFDPPLPKNCNHNGMRFRIWHRSQDPAECARCKAKTHSTNQTNLCADFRSEIAQDMTAFFSRNDPLSNFWKSPFPIIGLPDDIDTVNCAEQAYQYMKCKTLNCNELAKQILDTPDPAEQKRLTRAIPMSVLNEQKWDEQKLNVMRSVLKAKSDGCAEFRQRLIETGHSPIIEAGSSLYWASGLSIQMTKTTFIPSQPGKNALGDLLVEMRSDILAVIAEYDSGDESVASGASSPAVSLDVSDAEHDLEQLVTAEIPEATEEKATVSLEAQGNASATQNAAQDEKSVSKKKKVHKVAKRTLRSTNKDKSLLHTVSVVKKGGSLHAQTLNKIWERQKKKNQQPIPVESDEG